MFKSSKTERLTVSAIFIALGTILSLIQPFSLPQGGGITLLSMLPVIIISYRYGMGWGLVSSLTYAVLQMLTGFKTVAGFFVGEDKMAVWMALASCLLDYIVAYGVLCLGGLFRKNNKPSVALCLGSIVAIGARYIVHIISGAIIFGSWAEWFFTDAMGGEFGAQVLSQYSGAGLSIFYSIVYNGLYMIPEIIITAIGAYFIGKIPAITGSKSIANS